MDPAMRIFELGKRFPADEMYPLTGQIRRSSRSVCTNLAEAWRRRRYERLRRRQCPSGRNRPLLALEGSVGIRNWLTAAGLIGAS